MALSDHNPSLWHILVLFPFNLYPLPQEYIATEPIDVVFDRVTRPLMGRYKPWHLTSETEELL